MLRKCMLCCLAKDTSYHLPADVSARSLPDIGYATVRCTYTVYATVHVRTKYWVCTTLCTYVLNISKNYWVCTPLCTYVQIIGYVRYCLVHSVYIRTKYWVWTPLCMYLQKYAGCVRHCVCTTYKRTKRQKDKHVFALPALPSVTQ